MRARSEGLGESGGSDRVMYVCCVCCAVLVIVGHGCWQRIELLDGIAFASEKVREVGKVEESIVILFMDATNIFQTYPTTFV